MDDTAAGKAGFPRAFARPTRRAERPENFIFAAISRRNIALLYLPLCGEVDE